MLHTTTIFAKRKNWAILNFMFSNISTEQIVSIVLGVIVLALIFWVIRLEIRIKKLLCGKDGKSLEGTITKLGVALNELAGHAEKTDETCKQLDSRIKKSVRGVSTIRFNPYQDQGGNQSFATALLDEMGNGVVISSLYSREKVRIFAKPVISHDSEYELSTEEKKALSKAKI